MKNASRMLQIQHKPCFLLQFCQDLIQHRPTSAVQQREESLLRLFTGILRPSQGGLNTAQDKQGQTERIRYFLAVDPASISRDADPAWIRSAKYIALLLIFERWMRTMRRNLMLRFRYCPRRSGTPRSLRRGVSLRACGVVLGSKMTLSIQYNSIIV